MKKFKIIIFLLLLLASAPKVFAALTCTITASCVGAGEVKIMNVSDTDNAHAELPSQSNYTTFICCSGVAGTGNSCSGNYAVIGTLSTATTNSHFEEDGQSNYTSPTNDVCISNTVVPPTVAYTNTDCSAYDTEVFTISPATTNAHIGPSYTRHVCASIGSAISFDFDGVSDALVGFGTLSPSAARYATGDTLGSGSETAAHTMAVTTNAPSGYAITVRGDTLTHVVYPSATVTAIGGTSAASAPGTEQFGMRITASGGSGVVSAPYNHASNYAYDATASTVDEVASAATGDGVLTTYSVRYIANISPVTDAGDYQTTLTFIGTGNF